MKKVFVVLIAAVVLGTLAWKLAPRYLGPEDTALTLYGNVDIRSVELGFRVGGRIRELRFEEGDRVARGEALATLDKDTFEEELALAKANRDAAAADALKLNRGTRPQEIDQARARVAELETSLANAEKIYRRQKDLVATGAVARQDYDDAQTARDEAAARLVSAKKALALAVEGFRSEDILASEAALSAAETRVQQAQTRLDDTELTAPADGVILTRVREPGAVIAAGATVYELSLDRPIWVRAYVDEPDLGRVHPGKTMWVFTDSAPDKPYKAQVGFVSPEAEFTPKSVETPRLRTDLVYRLRVIVDEPDESLRQGMPVTVRDTPSPPESHPGILSQLKERLGIGGANGADAAAPAGGSGGRAGN